MTSMNVREHHGEEVHFKPTEVVGPDENGIKIVTEYVINAKGQKVKHVRTFKVTKIMRRVSRGVLERRNWTKFGECAGLPPGPDPATTFQSNEDIRLDLLLKDPGPSLTESDTFALNVEKPSIRCRICKQIGHWSKDCPKKGKSTNKDKSDKLKPGKYVPPAKREGSIPREERKDTVRVTNLPQEIVEDDLRELFGCYGHVSRVHLARDQQTQELRGFGFVTYVDPKDAETTIEKLNGHRYCNLILNVDWAKPRNKE